MKPMLAARCEDVATIQYPVLVSPKLDGVRAIIVDGQILSRSLKPIPNYEVGREFDDVALNGLDGELITGTPTDKEAYLSTVSNVMSQGGTADLVYLWVFDDMTFPNEPFDWRYARATVRVKELAEAGYRVCMVPHFECPNKEELERLEEMFLGQGYEGAMVRSYKGTYKYGRSTVREGGLLKVKRFMDSDALILAKVELMHNQNEQFKNELGHSKRSSEQAGLVGGGVLGSLLVKDIHSGVEFSVGSGFSYEQRKLLWETDITGQVIKYKFFPTGGKDKPRFPTFLGFRSKLDL